MADEAFQHRLPYYFAYTTLPSCFFGYPEFPRKIRFHPNEMAGWLMYLVAGLKQELPPELHSPMEGMRITAHRLGGSTLVLFIHLPPPRQALEVNFVALVYTNPLRYFTLGQSMDLAGETPRHTIREVRSDGAHGPRGVCSDPDLRQFARELCTLLDLPDTCEDLSDAEVRAMAPVLFPELSE